MDSRPSMHLFCVLGINDEEEIREPAIKDLEVVEISLHTTMRVSTKEKMKLQVTIEGTPLLALVDTGHTHNLINTSTAHELAIPTAPRPRIKGANKFWFLRAQTCVW